MSELEVGYISPYERIKSNAYWARVHIDTTLWPSDYGKEEYAAHINDCVQNPTRGFIVRKKYITGKPMNYPEFAKRNCLIFDCQEDVAELNKELKNKVNILYPKTKYARSYIIDNKRIAIDFVEKAKRYTKFDKAKIVLKNIFHCV